MKDSGRKNALQVVGSQREVTQDLTKALINRQTKPKLFTALDAYPLHAFSAEGRRNICQRFTLTDAELESVLLNYERPDEPTEAERRAADLAHLLSVTEEAVKLAPKRKPAARKGKKGGAKC